MELYRTVFILIAICYQAHSQKEMDDIIFKNIGTYQLGDIEKTLWVPNVDREWYLTRPICKAHGYEILTIKTLVEFNSVAQLCKENKEMFRHNYNVHIGGATIYGASLNDWYWITTNEKISNDLPWARGQPDHHNNNEFCLALSTDLDFTFNDIPCHGGWQNKFICEDVRNMSSIEYPSYEICDY